MINEPLEESMRISLILFITHKPVPRTLKEKDNLVAAYAKYSDRALIRAFFKVRPKEGQRGL